MDSIAALATASDIQMDYMRLLVVELQNQDPLEPLNNKEMAAQLSQFSQLQQLEAMNSSFAKVLTSVERAYASSLIGKKVSFVTETQLGTTETQIGSVDQVYNDVDGKIVLTVDKHTLTLDDIVSVSG